MSDDRSAKLLAKRAQIDAQLKIIKLRQSVQERKNDTRRKVIAGALALEHAELNEEFRTELFRLLNRYVKRSQDRSLFDLVPLANDSSDDGATKPGLASNDDEASVELSSGSLGQG